MTKKKLISSFNNFIQKRIRDRRYIDQDSVSRMHKFLEKLDDKCNGDHIIIQVNADGIFYHKTIKINNKL